MLKKIIFILILVLVLVFPLSVSAVEKPTPPAKPTPPPIPEISGDYPDPEHPGVRVRVFVHEAKEKLTTTNAASCADPDSETAVDLAGWHLPSNVTYNLNLYSVPSSVGANNLPQIASESFAVWVDPLISASKPVFTRGSDTIRSRSAYDGQNIIAWGRTSAGALGVTYIRYYSSNGLVVDVDTIMNKKYPWSWTPYGSGVCGNINAYDAQNILVHELGHWMGLDDEYGASYIDNTMYGYGSLGEVKKDTPENGDLINLPLIYR